MQLFKSLRRLARKINVTQKLMLSNTELLRKDLGDLETCLIIKEQSETACYEGREKFARAGVGTAKVSTQCRRKSDTSIASKTCCQS